MKKFCGVLILTVALLLAGSYDNRAEATDYYVGTSKDGYDFYLMTGTIEGDVGRFGADVRAVRGKNTIYIHYDFGSLNGWHFSNSQGFSGRVTSKTPIAQRILKYVIPNEFL